MTTTIAGRDAPRSGTHPLRRVLRTNGVFCLSVGLLALAGAGWLGALSGLPAVALAITGAATGIYGLFLLAVTAPGRGGLLLEWTGWTTFFVDALWATGSLAVLADGRLPLTAAGRGLVLALAGVVGLFAVLELRALRRRLGPPEGDPQG